MVVATLTSEHRHRHRDVRSMARDVTAQLLHLIVKLGRNSHVIADLQNDGRLQLAMRLRVEHLVVRSQGGGVRQSETSSDYTSHVTSAARSCCNKASTQSRQRTPPRQRFVN